MKIFYAEFFHNYGSELSTCYCLTLDNWLAADYATVNLRMFLASLVYKEQFYMWFPGGTSCE